MVTWRSTDEGAVASRRGLVAGMRQMRTTTARLARSGPPVHVVACLQDAAYVTEHAELLRQLAEHADLTVACVGRPRLDVPLHHVELDADDTLADELSLVVCSPAGGAALVAHELGASLPAVTLEAGRAFRFQATHARRDTLAHARRLLRELGARLEPEPSAQLLAAVAAMARTDEDDVLPGFEALLAAVEVGDEGRRSESTQHAPGDGGLATLAGWLTDAGPRSPVLGLVVVRAEVAGVADVLRRIASELGRFGDLVVAVPPDAAMLVLPGLTGDALATRAALVVEELQEALGTPLVTGSWGEVPAVEARRDLVGVLGRLLAELRAPAAA